MSDYFSDDDLIKGKSTNKELVITIGNNSPTPSNNGGYLKLFVAFILIGALVASVVYLMNTVDFSSGAQYPPDTSKVTKEKITDYSDSIGDTYTKSYTTDDEAVIQKLQKQVFGITVWDEIIPSIAGSADFNKWCDDIVKGRTNKGDISKPSGIVAYGDPLADPSLLRDTAKAWSPLKTGENKYTITGTGWVLDQNDTHYFIASNNHVLTTPTKGTGDTGDQKNGPSSIPHCITVMKPGQTSAQVDTSIGTRGLILNGRDGDLVDVAVIAVKKSDLNLSEEITPITLKKGTGATPNDFRDWFVAEKPKLYTQGFPQAVYRYNKSDTPWLSLDYEKSNGGIEIQNPDSSKTTWDYSVFSYDYFTNAGSSGSPVVDSNNELVFLNAVGSTFPSRETLGNHWSSVQSGGVAVNELQKYITDIYCPTDSLDLSICA